MRTSTKEMLWGILIVVFLVYQVVIFVVVFHFLSTREKLLFLALLIAGFLGVLVKGRKSRV